MLVVFVGVAKISTSPAEISTTETLIREIAEFRGMVAHWAEADELEQSGLKKYREQKHEAAINDLAKALEIKQQIVGKESETLSVPVNNLAGVWKATGRQHMAASEFGQAQRAFLQAGTVLEAIFGDHPAVAVCRNEAVQACKRQGKLKEAYELCLKNLATFTAEATREEEGRLLQDVPLVGDSFDCDGNGNSSDIDMHSSESNAARNVVQVSA